MVMLCRIFIGTGNRTRDLRITHFRLGVGIEGQCMVVLTPVLPTQNSSFNALDFNRYVMVQEFKRGKHNFVARDAC